MPSVQVNIHAHLQDTEPGVNARAFPYKTEADAGRYYLNVDVGNSSVTYHSLRPKDLWRISSAIEEAAVSVSPPDGWIEPPKDGALVDQANGCAGCGGPLDESGTCPLCVDRVLPQAPDVADIVAELSEDEQARGVRLAMKGEALLDLAKRVLCTFSLTISSPYTLDILSRAHAIIRDVEPATPELISTAQAQLSDDFAKRESTIRDQMKKNC